ncbi:MAG TPA: ATP-binding cassette domain-containing protein, partial [Candidatus Limnocylindrales bacterium]|nr:ATP-binding cassette domain-containing protein [Candidatus Limnocylindrales bacterium]
MHEMINPDMKNQKPYVVAGLYDVTKTVNGKQIVRGVDLEVQHGETLLITGPSGSGKSTCVRMLADLERPTTGDVVLFGSSLQDMKPKTTRQVIAERVSVATQDPSLAKNRTAWENLTRITEGIGGTWSQREISERAGHVALELGIVDLLERKTKTLSGGEQCWVAIGRALVKQPDLVILDEP